MVEPRGNADDDLSPDLPRADGGAEGEENFEPKDDSDLGLGDEKDVGLDGEAGFDEPLDGELEAGVEDDPASWLDDGAGPAPVGDDDGLDGGDDDSKLTEGSEPASDSDGDWDEFDFDDRAAEGDAGEEGFGDDSLLSGLEFEQLPPLDDSAVLEEGPFEIESFSAEAIAEMRAVPPDDEEASEELAPGLRATRLPSARVQSHELLRSGQPLVQLCAAGAAGIGWDGRTLFVAGPDAQRAEARYEPGPVQALAAAVAPEGIVIAMATPEAVHCSRDAGRNFARAPLDQTPGMPALLGSLAITRSERGMRLWAAGAAGPLFASDDGGQRFRCVQERAHVLRLAADGAASLVLLARSESGHAAAQRSRDGGEHFEPIDVPVSEPERVQALAIAGDVVLCCRRAPAPQLLVWSDGSWAEIAHATPPALVLEEGADAFVYFWIGARLVRAPVGGAHAQIVSELPADAGAPLQLCGHHARGVTTLQVGAERAWYRWVVSPEDDRR